MKIIDDISEFSKKELKYKAKEIDESQKFPKELIKELAEQKFLSVIFPKTLGGLELDPVNYGLFLEHAAKYCSNVRNLFLVSMSMVGGTLLKCGNHNQIKYWIPQIIDGSAVGAFSLTEPDTGSDTSSLKTTFEKVGNEYRINGKKKWTTMGGIANFLLLIAKNGDQTGAFIIETDRPGIRIRELKGLLGNRGSHVAEIELDNVIIPQNNLVGDLNFGMNIVASTALDIGRYNTAWGGVALAQACLEEMISYSRTRSQFGKKIRTFQIIQEMIGNAATNIQASRALNLSAGKLRMDLDDGAKNATTMAKYFSSKIAMQISQDAIQTHGGNGYSSEFPVERYFREAKALEIIEGTSQVLVQQIAKNTLININ
jgi:alkylation response protein AidB-like acyl-CoA dehydrogenase